MKKAILLLSGGLDSGVTLYYAKNKNFDVSCLTFDYHQRHLKEIIKAKLLAKKAKAEHIIIKLGLPLKGSALLDKNLKLPGESLLRNSGKIPITYVPARNIIFLSYALFYAELKAADSIFIGANVIDYSGYPDCRPEFLKAFMKAAGLGTKRGEEKRPIKIVAPLIKKSKSDIIRLGLKLKVPFEYTWSCYAGGKFPCGVCDSCRFRLKGFKEAGLDDPLLKVKRR